MVGSRGARKALTRALSRVVLSRETILVHAESVLERAELIEGSLHSSAFNLWFAVLQRAEAEGAVQRVVESVLEDNPGADPLRQALHDWQRATAAEAAGERPLPAPDAAAPSSTELASRELGRSERARWAVLAALVLGFAALFVVRALREPAEPAGEAGARGLPASPVQVGAALRALALTEEELLPEKDAGSESELLGSEGSAGGPVQKRGR